MSSITRGSRDHILSYCNTQTILTTIMKQTKDHQLNLEKIQGKEKIRFASLTRFYSQRPSLGSFQIICNERLLKMYLIASFFRQNKVCDRRELKLSVSEITHSIASRKCENFNWSNFRAHFTSNQKVIWIMFLFFN